MKQIAAPVRPANGITASIRALKKGEALFIKGGKPTSIRSLLTRLREEFGDDRAFLSKKQNGGVRVWRLS